MIEVDLAWVSKHTNASYYLGVMPADVASTKLNSVSTDTRTIKQGDLFIALKGDNFDAHDYLSLAHEKGAVACIVERACDVEIPQLVVKDTTLALGDLGRAVKQSLDIKTVAITGSSGKTTVKEMVKCILATRGSVLATAGNFNNAIGVPLTLLSLDHSHQYAVIEQGANHQGEIEYTTSLSQPDVSTIINAAPAHIEGFGSLFGVARAKGEIVKGLSEDAIAVLNKDSQFFDYWKGNANTKQILTFSYESEEGDFYPQKVSINAQACAEFELCCPLGRVAIKLRVPGLHNVGNAVVAAALASSVGATLSNIQQGLFDMQSVQGRLTVKQVNNQIKVLDDTYNANVGSVKAAIDLLANFSGTRIFVFGDMGELGDQAAHYHQQLGEYAASHSIDYLISSGQLSANASDAMREKGVACADWASAFAALVELIQAISTQNNANSEHSNDITVLVKGSRSAQMEKVVDALLKHNFQNSFTSTNEVSEGAKKC